MKLCSGRVLIWNITHLCHIYSFKSVIHSYHIYSFKNVIHLYHIYSFVLSYVYTTYSFVLSYVYTTYSFGMSYMYIIYIHVKCHAYNVFSHYVLFVVHSVRRRLKQIFVHYFFTALRINCCVRTGEESFFNIFTRTGLGTSNKLRSIKLG